MLVAPCDMCPGLSRKLAGICPLFPLRVTCAFNDTGV